jgi:hypothetical protein
MQTDSTQPARGTKPSGSGPVRKSRARPTRSNSGLKGRPSGILISPPWTRTSVSPDSGPVMGGLSSRLAQLRSAAVISRAGACARRRANWSIARSTPLQRRAVRWKIQKLSATTLTRCAATVLTSQPLHRLGDANCAASSPSIKLAIRRRSSATAAKTTSRSNRLLRKRAQPIGVNSTCSSLSPRMMNVGS